MNTTDPNIPHVPDVKSDPEDASQLRILADRVLRQERHAETMLDRLNKTLKRLLQLEEKFAKLWDAYTRRFRDVEAVNCKCGALLRKGADRCHMCNEKVS